MLQAAGAIGEEIAYAFAEAGAGAIAFADINEQKAKETAEKSKNLAVNQDYRVITFAVDITNPSSVQRLVDSVGKDFGRIDHCVNAAGVSSFISGHLRKRLTHRSPSDR